MIEDSKVYIEDHIKIFPSAFDGTSIAQQLREANAPVMLYADVRDYLWTPLQKERLRKSTLETALANLKYVIDKAYEEFKEEVRG